MRTVRLMIASIFRVKDLQCLGATETKLLYTLHWILLFASDECADADADEVKKKTPKKNPFFLFSVPSITVNLGCLKTN